MATKQNALAPFPQIVFHFTLLPFTPKARLFYCLFMAPHGVGLPTIGGRWEEDKGICLGNIPRKEWVGAGGKIIATAVEILLARRKCPKY